MYIKRTFKLLPAILIISFLLQNASVLKAQCFDDTFITWKRSFEKGNYEKIIKEAEKNLSSDQPHPYAINAWLTAHTASGTLTNSLQNENTNWHQMVQTYYQVQQLWDWGQDRRLYELLKQRELSNLHEQIWNDLILKSTEIDGQYIAASVQEFITSREYTFRATWAISNIMRNNQLARLRLGEEYEKGNIDPESTAGKYIYWQGVKHKQHSYDRITLVKENEELLKADAFANRYLAHRLKSQEHFEEAEQHYQKAFECNPFYGLDLISVANVQAAVSDFEKSTLTLRRAAKLYSPADTARYFFTNMADIYLSSDVKHLGKARTLLEQALKEYPEDPQLNQQMGRLEIESGSEEKAISYLQIAVSQQPEHLNYWETYLQALDAANMPEKFMDVLENLQNEHEVLNPSLYDTIAEMFTKYEEYDLALEYIEIGLSYYGESQQLYRQKGIIEDKMSLWDEAILSFEESIRVDDIYAWPVRQIVRLMKKDGRTKQQITVKLEELAVQYYWDESPWEVWHDESRSRDERVSIWQKAIELNPLAVFPYENILRNDLWDAGKWEKAFNNLLDLEQRMSNGNPAREDVANLHFERGIIYIAKLRTSGLTNDEYQAALTHFSRYLNNFGYKGAYYQYMWELHIGMAKSERAEKALRKWITYRPNDSSNRMATITEMAEKFPDGFLIFSELLERNPNDWEDWASLIQLNALYSGSAINAIRLADTFKERFPDKENEIKSYVNHAYGKLGANIKLYNDNYLTDKSVGKSQRYVNWFLGAKREALQRNTEITFDWDMNTATLLFEDGTIAKLTDHPIHSRTTKIQIGDAFIKAKYNQDILLVELLRSDSTKIELDYDENGYVTKLKLPDQHTVNIAYDSLTSKPNRLILESNPPDTLHIFWSKEGAIDSVSSSTNEQTKLKVSRIFNNLITYTRIFTNATQSITQGNLPDLGLTDEQYELLKERTKGSDVDLSDKLKLIEYLTSNTNVDPDYGGEALTLIDRLFHENKNSHNKDIQTTLFEIVKLNYELIMKIRSMGIPESQWSTWADMRDWLIVKQSEGFKPAEINSFIQRIEDQPLELLPSSKWLPKSDLYTTAYWKIFETEELVGDPLHENLSINTTFIRENGDILLGTNKGLLLYRKGFWQHFAYNFIKRSFQNNVEPDRIKATSNILSIQENDAGLLILGTADGLFTIDQYRSKIKKRLTTADGLPSNRIEHLSIFSNKILIGTPSGSIWFSSDLASKKSKTLDQSITFTDISSDASRMLIGTNKKVFIIDNRGSLSNLYEAPRKDGVFSAEGNRVYTLKGTQVWVKNIGGSDSTSRKEYALNGQLITTDAKQVYGLTYLPVNAEENALAVQTDLGFSIYHERHFEHFYLDRETGARPKLAKYNKGSFLSVDDKSVRIFERDLHDTKKYSVQDIVSYDNLGVTIFADGENPKIVSHDDPRNTVTELDPYSYMSTNILVQESDTTMLLNNGREVLRYIFEADSGTYNTQELFYVSSSSPPNERFYDDQSIKNIIIDKNGSIWVATGNSVFRYILKSNGEYTATEFNYFRDQDTFPCYSDRVYRIFKTMPGDIYAVCSNEGHRYYRGISLKGGLLKFEAASADKQDRDRFLRVDTEQTSYNWFINSYTTVDEDKAIIGTAGGFAIDELGNWNGLKNWKENQSYIELLNEHPNLYLGTKGAALGDLWLFGTPAGLVSYYDDTWFYPHRINAQLPMDKEYGKYGGRHVNSVATSAMGKIYVGTDLGLLIYDSGSDDPSKFIMDNYSIERSIEYFNTKIVEEEQKRIFSLKDIPEDSKIAQTVTLLKETKKNINEVKSAQAQVNNVVGSLQKYLKDKTTTMHTRDSLDAQLKVLNQKQNELLLTLQQQEPSIYQALQIDPLNLRSSRLNMNENDVVVQYLPMSRKLFIQVLAKDRFELREVHITGPALMDSVRLVASDLAGKSGSIRSEVLSVNGKTDPNLSEARLTNLLSFLYEHLLRPVQKDITGYKNVFIAPVSEFNYLPFSALIDHQNKRNLTYAAERFHIGYVSSMYLFNLIYKNDASKITNEALLIGDPDGSLPGAREEVKEIQQWVDQSHLLVGKNASTKSFKKNIESADIIHLATHGDLNEESLKQSWVLFSDKKFWLSEVYNLNLRNSSLVVLSACETSLGGDGLEYATLARAFLNAGSTSIVGTLWQVDDYPSKTLMVNFYKQLAEGHNKFKALALAQVQMIRSGDKRMNHPSKWASYIAIGKP